jgi:hypothetical protein
MNADCLGPLISEHLQARLERAAVRELTAREKVVLHEEGQKAFIRAQILSNRYRKWAADRAAQERIDRAIDVAVEAEKPLRFLHTMGGYKLWRLPSSPEIDWAEFFNVAYLLQYLSGIAAGYGPGVNMTYYVYTLLPQRHDNLTAAEVGAYVDSFTRLVDAFRPHLPANLSLSIVRDVDLYAPDEYFALLDERIDFARGRFPTFNEEWRNELLAQARRNIKWNGAEDWSALSDAEREEKVLSGAIIELAGMAMKKQGEFIGARDNVLLFVKPGRGNGFLGIGSTKSSVAKHWAGIGLLEYRKEEFYDVVLSPTQWERVGAVPQVVCGVDLLELRNLRQIVVVTQHLDFARS